MIEVLIAAILSAASSAGYEQADRISNEPAGLQGLPFAPSGLTDCENAEFYRVQWDLPERFQQIVWRESRCINSPSVKTFCCHSRYQLWVDLHMKDHRLAPRYEACQINGIIDVNQDTEEAKQKAACAAKALYDVEGLSPWKATA